jgi:hypothetical protein
MSVGSLALFEVNDLAQVAAFHQVHREGVLDVRADPSPMESPA